MDTSPVGDDARVCYNASCGKPLIQREGETRSKFAKRKHCNRSCSRTNPRIHEDHQEVYDRKREAVTKTCAYDKCGKEFHRRQGEPRPVFEERKTCSHVCANRKRAADRDAEILKQSKICTSCGKSFHRRKGSETTARFKARKVCSSKCLHRNRRLKAAESTSVPAPVEPEFTLPPVTPLARKIPDAPKAPPREVWRPESWKGMRDCRPRVERAS